MLPILSEVHATMKQVGGSVAALHRHIELVKHCPGLDAADVDFKLTRVTELLDPAVAYETGFDRLAVKLTKVRTLDWP